jgi:signal transduction histidine kinase
MRAPEYPLKRVSESLNLSTASDGIATTCGLGLYLVREIMTSQGGEAAVIASGPGATLVLKFAA